MASGKLTIKQERFVAAYLGVANGNATEAARIAEYAGSDTTLASVGAENLRKPQIAEAIAKATEAIRDEGISVKQNRVDALNDRWQRMKHLIETRSADTDVPDAKGGRTGLMVHTVKVVGAGQSQQVIDEYSFDAALMREMREHEKQAAQEMGQWTEKVNLSGAITFADLHALAATEASTGDS